MHIVFIGGPQRSGTTLVQTLIANSLGSSIVLPEAHAVCDLICIYKRGISEWPKTSYFFEGQLRFREYTLSCIRKITDSILSIHGFNEFLVLKDPNFALVQDEIVELFPEATSLFCIRDPRDIVSSFLRIEQREAAMKQERKQYTHRNISFYCSKIKKSCWGVLRSKVPSVVVRYEDVVTDPLSTLSSIANQTRLPLTAPDLNNMRWTKAEVRHKRSWVSPLEGRQPSKENLGRFTECLSNGEIAYVENSCKPILTKFGYSPSTFRSRPLPAFRMLNRIWHNFRSKLW